MATIGYNIFMGQDEKIAFTFFEEFFPKKPSKSDRRRLQIVEQIILELAEAGIDSTTHDSLAEACGVSRALVRHYFPDRQGMILMAMKYIRARFQKACIDAIQKETSPSAQLAAYIKTVCAWKTLHPKDPKVWLLFYYYCAIYPQYRKMNTELVQQGSERIAALVEKIHIELYGQSKATDLERRAKLIQNTITGFFISSMTETHEKKVFQAMVETTLRTCMAIATEKDLKK